MRCEVPQLLFLADGVPIGAKYKNGVVAKSRQNEHRWCAGTVGLIVKKGVLATLGHNYGLPKSYSLLRQGLVNCFAEMAYWDFSGKQDGPAETGALLLSVVAGCITAWAR
jgi:hypothetical protein